MSHFPSQTERASAAFRINPPPRHGDAITINGVVYTVVEVDVDPQGGAVLKLRVV
jgi:hypothetical protein